MCCMSFFKLKVKYLKLEINNHCMMYEYSFMDVLESFIFVILKYCWSENEVVITFA